MSVFNFVTGLLTGIYAGLYAAKHYNVPVVPEPMDIVNKGWDSPNSYQDFIRISLQLDFCLRPTAKLFAKGLGITSK
jgi:hypothetical protein